MNIPALLSLRGLLGKVYIDKVSNHTFQNRFLNDYLCALPLVKMDKSRWNFWPLSSGISKVFSGLLCWIVACAGTAFQALSSLQMPQECCDWSIHLNFQALSCNLLAVFWRINFGIKKKCFWGLFRVSLCVCAPCSVCRLVAVPGRSWALRSAG